MGRNKKTDTVKAQENVASDIQENQEIIVSDSPTAQETQLPNEGEEAENTPETENPKGNLPKSEPMEKIPLRDLELMRLYRQYERLWITPDGFVHPEGSPQYLLKGAKLYTNNFFNTKQ